MIAEYIRYQLPTNQREKFVEAYRQAALQLGAAPECLGYELSECADEPGAFILRIEWESAEAHMQGFRKGPQFPDFFACVKPFYGNIQEMRHYHLTDVRRAKNQPAPDAHAH